MTNSTHNTMYTFLKAYRPNWEASGSSDCDMTAGRANALTNLIADHTELAHTDISVTVWEYLTNG